VKAKKEGNYISLKGDDMKTFSVSDIAFLALLKRYKATHDQNEMQELSEQIERMIFHRQYENIKA
jgi:hypothetical protein